MRPRPQPVDESARRPSATRMFAQGGEPFEEAIREARDVDAGQLLELTKSNVARDDGSETPVIRPA